MKKSTKKLMAALLVLAIAVTAIPAANVQAAAPKVPKNCKFWFYEWKSGTSIASIYIQNPTAKGKITKLKNSNPSVAKVAVGGNNYLTVEIKKAGTSKVTFTYAGKKFSTKISIKKWESPCSQFKVGKKDYAKYFKKSGQYNLNRQKKDRTEKIKITPKKGWKLTKIENLTPDSEKTVKNNSKVKLSIKFTGTAVFAYFKNIKTGEKRKLYFGYSEQDFPSENICDGVRE